MHFRLQKNRERERKKKAVVTIARNNSCKQHSLLPNRERKEETAVLKEADEQKVVASVKWNVWGQ